MVAPLEEEEEEEEEESEYETDSEDEGPGRTLLKPIFVKKEERETIAEREALEKVCQTLVNPGQRRQGYVKEGHI